MRFGAAGYKVTAEEWAVLLLLWQVDGRTPGDISGRTLRDKTTVTRLADGMVRKDMVRRRGDDEDRRRSRVYLTHFGRDLEDRLVPIAQALIAKTLDGIAPNDVAVCLQVLRQMTVNFERGEG